MRRITLVETLPSIAYRDLVAAAGGKLRLRRQGHAVVQITDTAGETQERIVELIERPAWRGNSRSYLRCPTCHHAPVLRLLWHQASQALKCCHCWGPNLRYASQEARRNRYDRNRPGAIRCSIDVPLT